MCTGNICRSPMAEVMLGQRLSDAGVEATVHSAGFVTEDRPASEPGVELMAARGLDLRSHRSRKITPELIASADLILTMERAHVREVVILDVNAFPRTFTLPELVRRATSVGPRTHAEDLAEWLARVGAGRRPEDLLGSSRQDEIEDPYGRPVRAYRVTERELDDLLAALVHHLLPSPSSTTLRR